MKDGSEARLRAALAAYEQAFAATLNANDEKTKAEAEYRNAKDMEIARLILSGTAPSRAEKDWVYNTTVAALRDQRNIAEAVVRVRNGVVSIALQQLEVQKLMYQRRTFNKE